jgi:hypothetical protein
VRAHPTRFILRRGHEKPSVERVVEEKDDYAVVEKFERTVVRIVRSLDPRANEA